MGPGKRWLSLVLMAPLACSASKPGSCTNGCQSHYKMVGGGNSWGPYHVETAIRSAGGSLDVTLDAGVIHATADGTGADDAHAVLALGERVLEALVTRPVSDGGASDDAPVAEDDAGDAGDEADAGDGRDAGSPTRGRQIRVRITWNGYGPVGETALATLGANTAVCPAGTEMDLDPTTVAVRGCLTPSGQSLEARIFRVDGTLTVRAAPAGEFDYSIALASSDGTVQGRAHVAGTRAHEEPGGTNPGVCTQVD